MTTDYNEQAIIADYLSQTLFIKDICKKYNISDYIFNKILLKNKIKKYDSRFMRKQNQRKFPVNDNFFDTENSEMAYILGFLAADGTVRKDKNEIKLTLNANDAEFLKKLQSLVGGREIKIYEDSKGFKNATWIFTSKKIKEKLAEYNIVPNKTFSFTFPTNLNKNYWIDFVRGYFDGDGSISSAGPSAIRWQLCSVNKEVLQTIVDFLYSEYNIEKTTIFSRKSNRTLYYIQYSSVPTRKIFEVLYKNATLFLPRKKEKFEELYYRNLKK